MLVKSALCVLEVQDEFTQHINKKALKMCFGNTTNFFAAKMHNNNLNYITFILCIGKAKKNW